MADNLEKKVPESGKIEGAEEGKLDVKTLQEKYPWLQEKFIKGAKDETEALIKAGMSQGEAETRMHQLEAEVTKLKSGEPQTLREALAEKEDELARLQAEVEGLKKPQSTLSAEQRAHISNWRDRFLRGLNEDPEEAARALLEVIHGEISMYDRRKSTESMQERFERELDKYEDKLTKEEKEELVPYITQIKEQRPDLLRSRHGIEDIIEKAKSRLADNKKAMEIDEEIKTHQKEEAQTTSSEGTTGKPVELNVEEFSKLPAEEQEKLLREGGVKIIA